MDNSLIPSAQPMESSRNSVPSFYLTSRQPLRPGVLLLAMAAAFALLFAIISALGHTGHARLDFGSSAAPSANTSSGAGSKQANDDEDDPSQIDTIVLGDPADAPVPARHGNHVSPVHPTIVVRLPRFGSQTGLIPDSPAGHLLYGWLAAFNQASSPALRNALPTASASAAEAQMDLRRQTGGFNLLSAKEVQPGVLVFRLRDQTPQGTEALGTLQVQPDSVPAVISTFSLRAVVAPDPAPTP